MRAHRFAFRRLIALSVLGATAALPAHAADIAPVYPVTGGVAWTQDERARLRVDLDGMLATAASVRGAHVGVIALATDDGTVLYDRAADDAFQPASTLKLVVGSAALDRLGPAFRFRTTLDLASGPGAPSGAPLDLVLRAGGDPTLTSADLAAGVAALGVPAVSRVYVDDSAFGGNRYPDGWTWDDFAQDYAPPLSAATVDENVVDLRVAPGARTGDRARVTTADGRRVSSPAGDCVAARLPAVVVYTRATTGPAGSDDTIDVARTPADCSEVVGAIPLGAPAESIATAVYDPVVAAADALTRALAAAHVRHAAAGPESIAALRAPVSLVTARVAWVHDSEPLGTWIGPWFWIPSDNLFGELLLEELGRATGPGPGSTHAGIASEKTWLRGIGIDPATVTLADGCGMSQYDRITPRDLGTILQHDWAGPNRQVILDSLPVGAARGTIEGIAGTAAAGRVFAKTGSMMHVRGLAGYLATRRHGTVTFAFEVDDWNGDYAALAATRAAVLSRIVAD